MNDQQLITVTIPAAILPAVTRLMQEYFEGASGGSAAAASARDDATIGGLAWDRADVRALHSRHRSTRGRAELRLIAERSLDGLTTSYGRLMERAEVDSFGLRSDLAWLGRHATAVKGEKAFPLIVTDAGAKADSGSRLNYRMPRRMAEWWLEADDAEIGA
jgi:hypothetical protein